MKPAAPCLRCGSNGARASCPRQMTAGGTPALPPDATTEAEIKRLEKFIAEYSKRAELIITASYEEREELG